MDYSIGHKDFAYWLNENYNIDYQDVLDNPKKYIGQNYKEVLNYWFYRESLSHEQWDVFCERCWALDNETWKKAYQTSRELASEVIDPRFVAHLSLLVREIIAAHLYIERNIPFTFLPLIFDL